MSHQAIGLFLETAKSSDKDVQWQAEGAAGGFVREIGFEDDTPMMVWLVEPDELDVERLKRADVLPIDVKTYPIQIPAPQGGNGCGFCQSTVDGRNRDTSWTLVSNFVG